MAEKKQRVKSGMSLFRLLPMVIFAVLGPNFAEDRISALLGIANSSVTGAAIDGAVGGGLGVLFGLGLGMVLEKIFVRAPRKIDSPEDQP
tara:strand:+ start:361 stop:630 length:270 start_codon:yes stop_codon:yes gene_type:complete